MRHEVGDLRDVSCHLNELSSLQEVVVRMVDSYLKSQGLQKKYFVVLYPLLQLEVLRARNKLTDSSQSYKVYYSHYREIPNCR